MKVNITSEFNEWVNALKDNEAKAVILKRLRQIEKKDFGEFQSVKSKVFELEINSGPGYRIYFYHTDKVVVILNGCLEKDRKRGISQSIKMWKELHNDQKRNRTNGSG